MPDDRAPSNLSRLRLLLWLLSGLALAGLAAVLLIPRSPAPQQAVADAGKPRFGGPFTLTGGDGRPFSSARLAGKPFALYFGFTRCGDTCPTTLSRMVRLRGEVGGPDALSLLFITIDPDHDGPREVGQYARLFNSPIIGLTSSRSAIDRVKKQFGIYAAPVPHAQMGDEMAHSATVLLFGRDGRFAGTITPDEHDPDALAALKRLVG